MSVAKSAVVAATYGANEDVLLDAEEVVYGAPAPVPQRVLRVVPNSSDGDKTFASLDAIMQEHTSGSKGDGSGLPDKIQMQRDVFKLQARLHRMNRGLLNPHGKLMQRWDFFTLSALFYTATVTPYEVCLLWDEPKFADGISAWLTPLFVVNWFVNIIFMIDICFNFFLPYRESIKKGGATVKDHRKIARNYMHGWFGLDLVSVIPVDNIMMAIDTSQMQGASVMGAIRLLRLLRLIKLARILRASRIFSRWENSISLSYARQDLIRWTVVVLLLLHWLACILGIVAQLMAPPRTDELAEAVERAIANNDTSCYGCLPDGPTTPGSVCKSPCLTPCEVVELAHIQLPNGYEDQIAARISRLAAEQNWVCRYSEAGKVSPPQWHGEVWVAGLYVAMIQLGGGVGSIVPENFIEYIVFIVGILLGSVTWAMVVGTICATMATGDPHTNAFKQSMDSLNYFLEDMQMPNGLRIRAREYLRNTRDLYKKSTYNTLIAELSPDLRADIVLHMSAKTLEQVWYLVPLEQGARVELATKMHRSGFAPREKVSSEKLNILMRGVAAKAGNILTPPSHWGDDIIVTSPALRDLRPASALTYVEVATLARADLDEVLADFPQSAAIIRQAAMRVAVQRAVVIISDYVRSRQELRAKADPKLRGQQWAHASLTRAFGYSHDPSAPDPAMVLRLITGNNLKDIVDGQMVEEVGGPDDGDEEKALLVALRREREERGAMRSEIVNIKSELSEIKGMLSKLVPPRAA